MRASTDISDRGPLFRKLSILLPLLLLLLAAAAGYWWYASPSALLSGQVVAADSNRQPVSGAEITVVGTPRTVRTDSQGRFHLKLLPAGAIQVKVVAPGYDDALLTAQMNRGAETQLDVALASSRQRSIAAHGTAIISGQVLDNESGQPLAGVRMSNQGSTAATVSTSADGRFQFAPSSENKAEVQAELPGYQKTTSSWLAGAKPLSIRLSGAASLAGNVVAEAYDRPTPILGTSVRLIGSDRTTTTDRDGRFSFQSLVGGRNDLQVEISAEGYATRTLPTSLPNEGALLPNVALAGTAVVNGSVTDQLKGQPIAGVTVGLQGTHLKARSEPDGKFAIAAVPPGNHTLHVSCDGFRDAEKSATVLAKDNRPIDLALAGASSLRGSVVWDGPDNSATAISSASIAVKGMGPLTKTDSQGHFSLDELPPQPVTLVVKSPGFLPKEVQCDPRANVATKIRLRGDSALSGRVIDTTYDPPRPIPAATVRLDNSPIVGRSDDRGLFALDGVPSGGARIIVSAPGYIPCELSQRLARDLPGQLGDVALAGNSEVEGTVVRAGSDLPVAHADVRINGTAVATRSDDAGHFCLSGLPPGKFDLAVGAPGYEPVERREVVASGTNTVKVPLKKDAVVDVVDSSPTRQVAAISPPAAPGSGVAPGPGAGSGGGDGGGSGSGAGASTPPPQPGNDASDSWNRPPDEERLKKAVFYIATGKPFSAGRVYMVSVSGNILASVGLRFAPAGMAFHAKSMEDCGLVLAVPRDRGKIMRVDKTGKVWTILDKDPVLLHPVDVGIPGGTDDIFVADDENNLLARTQIDGRPAGIFRPKPSSGLNGRASLDMGMSLAATGDKHVLLGTPNPPGVFRFAGNDKAAVPEHCLSTFGGVAADIHSARWAAAQPPNQVCLYQGPQMVKQLSLPPGLVHYGNGLMSFANDDGWLCVACVDKDHPDDGIRLCLCSDVKKGLFEQLFQWKSRPWTPKDMPDVTFTDKDINSFVIGPWSPWPGALLSSGGMPPPPKQ